MTTIAVPYRTPIQSETRMEMICNMDIREYPALTYDIYRDSWHSHLLGLQTFRDKIAKPCVAITLSNGASVVLTRTSRVLCHLNDNISQLYIARKPFSISAENLQVGMICVADPSHRGMVYVDHVVPAEDLLVRHIEVCHTGTVCVSPGIVLSTS